MTPDEAGSPDEGRIEGPTSTGAQAKLDAWLETLLTQPADPFYEYLDMASSMGSESSGVSEVARLITHRSVARPYAWSSPGHPSMWFARWRNNRPIERLIDIFIADILLTEDGESYGAEIADELLQLAPDSAQTFLNTVRKCLRSSATDISEALIQGSVQRLDEFEPILDIAIQIIDDYLQEVLEEDAQNESDEEPTHYLDLPTIPVAFAVMEGYVRRVRALRDWTRLTQHRHLDNLFQEWKLSQTNDPNPDPQEMEALAVASVLRHPQLELPFEDVAAESTVPVYPQEPKQVSNIGSPDVRENTPRLSPDTVANLLSQLEESKLLRLLRYLVDSDQRTLSEEFYSPSKALGLPDTELVAKNYVKYGSRHTASGIWVFQVEHVPTFLWDESLRDAFFERRLQSAFSNLKHRQDLLSAFSGKSDTTQMFPYRPEIYDGMSPYDYYLFTNYRYDISEDGLEKFTERARALFGKTLCLPPGEIPRFGIGTPDTTNVLNHQMEKFLLDLMNSPSSYYLVAREGHISVVPVTEHGAYLASNICDNGLSTVVTSVLPSVQSAALTDFELLINSRGTKEVDLQRFLEAHPHFLTAIDERYCEVRSHVCLHDPKGTRLVPDFMARVQDSDVWDVIELKRPQHDVCVRSANGLERVASQAARGISQLLQYRDYLSKRSHRDRMKKHFGNAPYEPCLVLVLGRGRTREHYEWKSVRAGIPSVKIVSYDFLFERAQACRALLQSSRISS